MKVKESSLAIMLLLTLGASMLIFGWGIFIYALVILGIAAAALGIIAPLAVGFVLGPNGVVGMLAGATVSGFLMAIFMSRIPLRSRMEATSTVTFTSEDFT